MERQGQHLQEYKEEKELFSSYQYLMEAHINEIEGFLQQYRNVIEQAGSLETMNMGEIFLPKMLDSISELESCHAKITEKHNQK